MTASSPKTFSWVWGGGWDTIKPNLWRLKWGELLMNLAFKDVG